MGAEIDGFVSTYLLPMVFSRRASTTRMLENAAHAGAPGNSPGLAIVLYWSGTAVGAREPGIAVHPAIKSGAAIQRQNNIAFLRQSAGRAVIMMGSSHKQAEERKACFGLGRIGK